MPLDRLEGGREHLYDLPLLQLHHLQGWDYFLFAGLSTCAKFCVHNSLLNASFTSFHLCYCIYIHIMLPIVCLLRCLLLAFFLQIYNYFLYILCDVDESCFFSGDPLASFLIPKLTHLFFMYSYFFSKIPSQLRIIIML